MTFSQVFRKICFKHQLLEDQANWRIIIILVIVTQMFLPLHFHHKCQSVKRAEGFFTESTQNMFVKSASLILTESVLDTSLHFSQGLAKFDQNIFSTYLK